jgi:hypothetical protein
MRIGQGRAQQFSAFGALVARATSLPGVASKLSTLTYGAFCGNVRRHNKFPVTGIEGNSGEMPGLPPQL